MRAQLSYVVFLSVFFIILNKEKNLVFVVELTHVD